MSLNRNSCSPRSVMIATKRKYYDTTIFLEDKNCDDSESLEYKLLIFTSIIEKVLS